MAIQKNHFTLRLDPITHEKIRQIAENENRSLTNMIELLIKQEIKRYETENGDIKCQAQPEK